MTMVKIFDVSEYDYCNWFENWKVYFNTKTWELQNKYDVFESEEDFLRYLNKYDKEDLKRIWKKIFIEKGFYNLAINTQKELKKMLGL